MARSWPLLSVRRVFHMRFFVPTITDLPQAEQVYQGLRDRLADARPTDRRICRVKYQDGEHARNIAVGESLSILRDEPVLAIIEASDCFFVCTIHHDAREGEPLCVPRSATLEVEEFTALA